jgi:hypothetical protein
MNSSNSSFYSSFDETAQLGCVHMVGKTFMDFMNEIRKQEKKNATFNINTFHNIGINMIINLINDAIRLSKEHEKQPHFSVSVDLKGIAVRHIDHQFFVKITNTLKHIFVDCLDKCYFHNCPTIFDKAYGLIMPLIDPLTREKIIIIKNTGSRSIESV